MCTQEVTKSQLNLAHGNEKGKNKVKLKNPIAQKKRSR